MKNEYMNGYTYFNYDTLAFEANSFFNSYSFHFKDLRGMLMRNWGMLFNCLFEWQTFFGYFYRWSCICLVVKYYVPYPYYQSYNGFKDNLQWICNGLLSKRRNRDNAFDCEILLSALSLKSIANSDFICRFTYSEHTGSAHKYTLHAYCAMNCEYS